MNCSCVSSKCIGVDNMDKLKKSDEKTPLTNSVRDIKRNNRSNPSVGNSVSKFQARLFYVLCFLAGQYINYDKS